MNSLPQRVPLASSRFSVAPMLDWTDSSCRYFLRCLSQHTLLYTEMVTTGALIHGDAERYLHYHTDEHPLALQLGGSDPHDLALCATLAQQHGYDEVNLNCGCPSDRVQRGRFGACLMAEPQLVADCLQAMQQRCTLPITVKTRIGIDEHDDYAFLHHFVATIYQAGCRTVILHARKAWLAGLSPKQNRDVPPLDYSRADCLKRDFPDLTVILNGGITDLSQAQDHLSRVDGVMLGRAIYHNPYLLAHVDRDIFGADTPIPSRLSIITAMQPYIEAHLSAGGKLNQVTRHMLNLFQGVQGARHWRRYLSEHACRDRADLRVLHTALAHIAEPL